MDNREQAIRWLDHVLASPSLKLAANIHYDLDALKVLGINVNGELHDVQTNEALICPNESSFTLESIARRRLGEGKHGSLLGQVLADSDLSMSELRMLSAGHVAPYAIQDAELLLPIYESQRLDIRTLDLGRASARENKLTRVLWKMHQKGIRVNVEKAEEISKQWSNRADMHLARALDAVPIRFNPGSSKSLGNLIRHLGYLPNVTDKGNDSVSNELLKSYDNPVLSDVYEYRRLNKIRRDFIDGLFLKYHKDGRVHPQWFQSRHEKADDSGVGGAETGRITGSKPNLTQIPSRDPELGPLTRSLVLPEEGAIYCKGDYSSQEPRWVVHFAYLLRDKYGNRLEGAAEARQMYIDDNHTDFHQYTKDLILERSGVDLSRREAKDINLGLTYGMGKPLLASKLGMTIHETDRLYKAHRKSVPFIDAAAKAAADHASLTGMVRTWGGRIRLFNQWESTQYDNKGLFDTKELCDDSYGNSRRAKTHKALNSIVQGTAADQMKEALIALDDAGHLPLLQVYDETGLSVDTEKTGWECCRIMEEALPGEVPALVEPEFGPNWGELK